LKIATFFTYFGEQNDLKKKHARSIKLLYGKKLKICPNCSLRLTSDAFSKHMKWHFHRRNEILIKKRQSGFKSQQYGKYRNWYCEQDQWLNATETNMADDNATMNKMNPFENINSSVNAEEIIKDKLLFSIDQNNKTNYEESQVLLSSGIAQVVVCTICNEEFAKTCKEYSAQKDDWILKGACFEDGSTSKDARNKDNVRNLKIVHRKCWELKQQQLKGEDDDRLKPKLYDKNQTISKIEEHFNENGASAAALSEIQKKQKKRRAKKRKMADLFDVLTESELSGHTSVSDVVSCSDNDVTALKSILKIGKKRKLNDGKVERQKIVEIVQESEKEELDVELDDDIDEADIDDDLQGIGIDDIDEQMLSSDQDTSNGVVLPGIDVDNDDDEIHNLNEEDEIAQIIQEAEVAQVVQQPQRTHRNIVVDYTKVVEEDDEEETTNNELNDEQTEEEEEEEKEELSDVKRESNIIDDKLDAIDLDDVDEMNLDDIELDDIYVSDEEDGDGDNNDEDDGIILFNAASYAEPQQYGYRRY